MFVWWFDLKTIIVAIRTIILFRNNIYCIYILYLRNGYDLKLLFMLRQKLLILDLNLNGNKLLDVTTPLLLNTLVFCFFVTIN